MPMIAEIHVKTFTHRRDIDTSQDLGEEKTFSSQRKSVANLNFTTFTSYNKSKTSSLETDRAGSSMLNSTV